MRRGKAKAKVKAEKRNGVRSRHGGMWQGKGDGGMLDVLAVCSLGAASKACMGEVAKVE